MKALSVRQPWASLLAFGLKDVENRTYPARYRGPFLIHAARTPDSAYFHKDWKLIGTRLVEDLKRYGVSEETIYRFALDKAKTYLHGGFIGVATIVDTVRESCSPWFVGPFGWLIKNGRTLPFHAYRGEQFLFEVPQDLALELTRPALLASWVGDASSTQQSEAAENTLAQSSLFGE